jgi:hypothetical protein
MPFLSTINFILAGTLTLSVSSLAVPLNIRQETICSLADSVLVTAIGAAGESGAFNVVLDNEWHDLDVVQGLSALAVKWPGFPTVKCTFQGVETGVMLANGNNVNSEVTFDVGPPQVLASAQCSCG